MTANNPEDHVRDRSAGRPDFRFTAVPLAADREVCRSHSGGSELEQDDADEHERDARRAL